MTTQTRSINEATFSPNVGCRCGYW